MGLELHPKRKAGEGTQRPKGKKGEHSSAKVEEEMAAAYKRGKRKFQRSNAAAKRGFLKSEKKGEKKKRKRSLLQGKTWGVKKQEATLKGLRRQDQKFPPR